ncbi:hypothetical protein GcM3_096023 [Golovinomyces cichoracearum]|uniref:Uncharacterized protein n=1 Tax=Golovinomyces cichoracearum TaxID=62708 RepID=A0A420IEG0_9PEZI|nr:hypothetical protein GcM3_096023 [Golovinomyces cichoracearum]
MSPDFTRNLFKLGARINRRKNKPENENSGVNVAATFRPVRRKPYTSTAGLVLCMGVAYDDKAFRFPAKLLIYDNEHPMGVEIGLEAYHVMADQGSDTNVIANCIQIGEGGIWRMIDAFVRSHNDHGHNQAIMLGLPWLHIVNAVIDVKNSSITVGDEGIGEKRIIIDTPRFTTSKYHTLTLYSTDNRYKKCRYKYTRRTEYLW